MSAAIDHRPAFAVDRQRALALVSTLVAPIEAKLEALAKLEAIADADAVLALGILVAEVDPPLRSAIQGTVLRLGGERRFIAELGAADAAVRARAAHALGGLRHFAAVPALIDRLTDPDAVVREQVASALIRLRDPRAESALIHGLRFDPSPDVRSACAQALGELGAADALIAAASTEEDPFTVLLIERSLWRLENRARG